MNKDYKIGIVVGLVVLALGVVYYTVTNKPAPPAEPVAVPAEADNQPMLGTTAPPADTVVVPVEVPAPVEITLPEAIVPPADEKADVKPLANDWGLPSPADKTKSTTAGEVAPIKFAADKPASVEPGAGETGYASPDEGSGDTGGEYFRLDEGASVVAGTIEPEVIRPETADQPAPVAYRGKDSYVVQTGDDLWTIAERVYGTGNGKYYKLIEKANPEIDPDALKVGKKLRIPPMPSASVTAETPMAMDTTRTTRPGSSGVTDPTKPQTYVVTGADAAGYWGIAKKVYGEGNASKYVLIQQANPKIDPQKLRVGTKLIIPPLPKETPATRSVESIYRSGTSTTSAVPGQTYIIKKGDTVWAIAERVYGNGTYSSIIVKANPQMDPENLKLGQKITLPPKPMTTRTPSRSRTVTSPPRTRVAPGEPDFGP